MPNIIEITDFSAPELDVYARLTEAQLRNSLEPEKGVFIAETQGDRHGAGCRLRAAVTFMERKQIADAQDILTRCGDSPYTRPNAKCWPG